MQNLQYVPTWYYSDKITAEQTEFACKTAMKHVMELDFNAFEMLLFIWGQNIPYNQINVYMCYQILDQIIDKTKPNMIHQCDHLWFWKSY